MSKSAYSKVAERIIGRLAKNTEAMREDIQVALLNCAMHTLESGDYRLYDPLLDALKGVNRDAVMAWIVKYGFVTYKSKEYQVNKSRVAAYKGATLADLATETPFWYADVKTRQEVKDAFDLDSRILSLVKLAETKKQAGAFVDDAKLQALLAIAS